ncbi:MAG: DUF3784 domain-containing protein [Roseburia sp.]|nr:DUF3784 domain-containing protein [Roseburia sp.]
MEFEVPVIVIYVLFVIFAVLSAVFLKGKGSSLFAGHSTVREPAFAPVKLCKAMGICFAVLAIFLLITVFVWNQRPDWFRYVLWVVVGGNIIAATIIANLNILFRR